MASSETHSASTTLDDIINELKLTYDSSVGLLDGDSIRSIPSVNILSNLSKLLGNLSKDLVEVEQIDNEILTNINSKLGVTDIDDEIDQDNEAKPRDKLEDNRTRSISQNEDEDEEAVKLSKRRKLNSQVKVKEEDEEERDADTKDAGDVDDSHLRDEISEEGLNTKDDNTPPVQVGSYTQENDTRLKNPKSEFVTSQTLPAEAVAELGLFSEDNNGLESHGKEYLKKKYGVASYPEKDLLDMLPGKIPDIDFSKNKPPSNQVQFTTYQSYIESYFRWFLNDDIKFLNEKNVIPPGLDKQSYDPNVTPYIIPKLGQFYADTWAEEDATLGSKLNSPAFQQPSVDSYKAKGTIDNLNDDNLYTEEVSCGPLSNRLLSAILSTHEGRTVDEDEDEDEGNEDNSLDDDVATRLNTEEDYKLTTEVSDFHSIEERLKRELKYIGIFMNLPNSEEEARSKLQINGRSIKKNSGSIIDSDEWIKNKEDDEVCAEIRSLQKELKESSARNKQIKKKLIPIVEEQIAWQEYCTILDDLDKQVDQAYMKRLKAKNKKKKSESATPQQQAVNSGLRALLDKRRRWIDHIGRLFKSPEIMKRVPKESVLQGESEVEDEGEDDENVDAEDAIIQK